MAKFEAAIPEILAHEGTDTNFWVNDPADPGGETVWGWSIRTIKELGLTPGDLGLQLRTFQPGCLKLVSKATCASLYKRFFWDKYGYGSVADQTAATKMFDAAVNMGPKRAAEFAQRACNALGGTLLVDGGLGPKSYLAINACDPEAFVRAYGAEMTAYYLKIIDRNPALGKFQKTWLRRAQWGVVVLPVPLPEGQ